MTEATLTYSARNMQAEVCEIPIAYIAPSPRNARRNFAEEELQQLADSIREHGLIEPVVVREERPDMASEPHYELIAGERRWRASKLAGRETILARIMHDVDDATALKLGLVENLQRVNLNPLEEAEGYRVLADELGMTQRAIAEAVNRSQPAVANALRLLGLPEDVRELIREGKLSRAHGVAILRFKGWPAVMSMIADLAVAENTAAHTLEKGLPFSHKLRDAGLIAAMGWGTRNMFPECGTCPFSAFVGEEGYGFCLKPEHYAELQAQAQQAGKEKVAAGAEAAMSADDTALPQLKDMDYTAYTRVAETNCPSGCTAECPCRGRAIGHEGKIYAICTNPAQYRKHELAAARARNREEREQVEGLMAGIPDDMDGPTVAVSIGTRELAILTILAAGSYGMAKSDVDEAIKRSVGQVVKIPNAFNAKAADVARIEQSAVRKLALAVVEVAVRNSAEQQVKGYGGRPEFLEMYRAAAPSAPETLTGTPLTEVLTSTCSTCSRPLTQEDIDNGDELCADCWAQSLEADGHDE